MVLRNDDQPIDSANNRRHMRGVNLYDEEIDYDLDFEQKRVFRYLAGEGRQSSCQVSVGLNLPQEVADQILDDLVRSGSVRREPLPANMEKYREPVSNAPPVFLYGVIRKSAPDWTDAQLA